MSKSYQIYCENDNIHEATLSYLYDLGFMGFGNQRSLKDLKECNTWGPEGWRKYKAIILYLDGKFLGGNIKIDDRPSSHKIIDHNFLFSQAFLDELSPKFIEVPLNNKYTAKVFKDKITVADCTGVPIEFPLDIVSKLYNAQSQFKV